MHGQKGSSVLGRPFWMPVRMPGGHRGHMGEPPGPTGFRSGVNEGLPVASNQREEAGRVYLSWQKACNVPGTTTQPPSKEAAISVSLFYRWANGGPNTLHLVCALKLGLCDSQTVLFILHALPLERYEGGGIDKLDPSRGILGPEEGRVPSPRYLCPGTSAWVPPKLVSRSFP